MFIKTEKPIQRSRVRKILGKEFFILKRKLKWAAAPISAYATVNKELALSHIVFEHKSFLLRPLKDVEMYLQYNKITNLKLAVDLLNKVVIKPRQMFSIWKLVGRPTKAKGYLDGLVLDNGRITKGVGGGLCQLGNLLYWMSLHSPLTVKERWRHSYDVFPDINRTIPFACGATLSYNYIDLVLENNTDKTFQIELWLSDEYLNGRIYADRSIDVSYEIFETDHCFRQQDWGGYTRHNRIWKRVTNNLNGIQRDELIATNEAILMYNPYLGAGTK